jgi:hypothetical protein
LVTNLNQERRSKLKVSQEIINKLEYLFQTYETEVNEKLKNGLLKESAAKTYLLHSSNFIRWCKDDFVPGARNENKNRIKRKIQLDR